MAWLIHRLAEVVSQKMLATKFGGVWFTFGLIELVNIIGLPVVYFMRRIASETKKD
eukprot:CAMPEP_0180468042 /NCGR_PEP_ID=MMETSP1036_2-20121128/27315_1 /TAXON_ID=632150 /ORGANISM="Azadinium spinosum, Strain 3D9" /LENGTH=55 /DNA_ID=CAMNT_0022475031 /DNA_START=74 /DNA_END=241 /DNA_ORIENTATION=-